MAEMVAMKSAAAPLLHPIALRQRQCGLAHNAGNGPKPLLAQTGRVDGNPGSDQRALDIISPEHFAGKRPEVVDGGLRPPMALRGPVAEPDDPLRRMPQMVGALLFGFRGYGSQRRIARVHHRAPVKVGERGIEELTHDRAREVAVRLFEQEKIEILPDTAKVSELVFVVALAFDLGDVAEELTGLT